MQAINSVREGVNSARESVSALEDVPSIWDRGLAAVGIATSYIPSTDRVSAAVETARSHMPSATDVSAAVETARSYMPSATDMPSTDRVSAAVGIATSYIPSATNVSDAVKTIAGVPKIIANGLVEAVKEASGNDFKAGPAKSGPEEQSKQFEKLITVTENYFSTEQAPEPELETPRKVQQNSNGSLLSLKDSDVNPDVEKAMIEAGI